MIRFFVSISFMIAFIVVFLLNRLSEFDLSEYGLQREISFKHNSDTLEGTLILPPGRSSPPFVLLVHGDGPQDRWSEGGYIPLVKFLISQGIAVYSWDKPGVGGSTGNWLAQSMSDRAQEASVALQMLREEAELKHSRGGFLGFSQAGWVVPKASQLTTVDFSVLIGVAINWRDQGLYYMEQRLKSEGLTMPEILVAKKYEAESFDKQYTVKMAALPCNHQCTRQDFERRNSRADATQDIEVMQTPVLILMGQDDRNVDPNETVTVWDKVLPSHTSRCIRQLQRTTHGLLRSEWFDYQLTSQWPLWKKGGFLLLGHYSYSPGALNAISSWIVKQNCGN